MSKTQKIEDSELAAIAAGSAVLSKLADSEARRRVLAYLFARHLPEAEMAFGPASSLGPLPVTPAPRAATAGREIPGIARLTESGAFEITLDEIGAKSRLDAVVRLAKIAIHAHERLTGRPLSSRRFLTPLLRGWRLYDGNTRARLAREPGIVRNRDELSLDAQGRLDAELMIGDLRSPAKGTAPRHRFERESRPRGQQPNIVPLRRAGRMLFDHIENWDNFTNKCSVGIHTVNRDGIVLWANKTELDFLGYEPEDYIGHFIGDFHVDAEDVAAILGMLTRFETVQNFPARMRAKDGSTKFVIVNSNVYRQAAGEFGHSRCFTTEIDEAAWVALKSSVRRTGNDPQQVRA